MSKKVILRKFLNSSENVTHYRIESDRAEIVKRFNLRGRKIKFTIRPVPDNVEPTSWIKDAVYHIIKHITSDINSTDKIGLTFCGESFEERGPAFINFKTASELKFLDVWDIISKVFQSNSEGLSTDTFCIIATQVKLPAGLGRSTSKYINYTDECLRKSSIIRIKNKDNLCLPRALVVAIARVENFAEYRKILNDTEKLQTLTALYLVNNSGVSIPSEGCGIRELQQFQSFLNKHKIVVYKYGEARRREVIFKGNNDGKSINLLYHDHHYNVITSLTAFFCCSYYCEDCHIPYYVKNEHRCSKNCPCCQKTPQCPKNIKNILCKECNRTFRGQTCLDNHKASTSTKLSMCEEIQKCKSCFKVHKSKRSHKCGEFYCSICNEHVMQDHQCFIQKVKNLSENYKKDFIYIFYDLETRQEDNTLSKTKQHTPNLCILQQRCDNCIDEVTLYYCRKCGLRERCFEKENIISKFMDHIIKLRTQYKKVIVIAHNGQAFDHQFVLNYILTKTVLQPKLIMRGTKIILMLLDNIKFIDSLNYFPMALSKLPKAFNLPTKLKKGYFPHLFNKVENQNYIGTLPSMKYYAPDTKKEDERSEFLQWYEKNKNSNFNMQKELIEYCINDVKILTEACLTFRKMFLQECNVEPFLEATTIASACNLAYRRNFLIPNTIGIIPKKGYRLIDNQSKIAMQWLIWEEDSRKIKLQCGINGREKIIAGVKVDGYCEDTKEVYDFYGCYYHGHPKCLTTKRDTPLHKDSSDTLNRRYEKTLSKSEHLKFLGYNVVEMWECEFREELNKNINMKYLKNHQLLNTAPLNPRDAFYGGRTGNVYTYYKCKPGEKIKYIDICSLYPYVCKRGKFPIKHPTVYIGENTSKLNISTIDGIIKCKMLPPPLLLHPVLPLKQNNKLMFSLCRSCSEEKYQGEYCYHTDTERSLIGTWVIDEVVKAIEKGYELINTYEVWEYKTVKYDKINSIDGLFTSMMNKFIKIKQEASGWPNICQTEKEKENYIENFLNLEEIKLDYEKILNNPGLRSFAKLILNSFWGKFGQRENQQQTMIVNQPFQLYELLTNPSVEVCSILPINEENIIVSWQYKDEAANSLPTINVCIAAYTTTQARLKLYSYLEELNDRVLYYDTDSVIYISKAGEKDPALGEYIGDMTDELECYGVGSYITEFVSGGPKNYAYKVYCTKDNTEKVVCKVKGISLNYNTAKQVNFESIKDAVLNFQDTTDIFVISDNIKRTQNHEVFTTTETKRYQPRSEKRRILEDHSSVPYGYKRQKLQ